VAAAVEIPLPDELVTAGYGGFPGVHEENSGTAERVSAKLAAVFVAVADCCGSVNASIVESIAAVIVIGDVIAHCSIMVDVNELMGGEEDNRPLFKLQQPAPLTALQIVANRTDWLRL
jgi:hypothetical protein